MLILALAVDVKIVVPVAGLLLAIGLVAYKVHRDSLDKPKVRVTASGAVVSLAGFAHYLVVTLTNSGRRTVTLTSLWFKSATSGGQLFTHPSDPLFANSSRFPVQLDEGERAQVFIPRNAFAEACSSPVTFFLAPDTTGKTWKSDKYPIGREPLKPVPVDSD